MMLITNILLPSYNSFGKMVNRDFWPSEAPLPPFLVPCTPWYAPGFNNQALPVLLLSVLDTIATYEQ